MNSKKKVKKTLKPMKNKKSNLKTTVPSQCSCEEKEANRILKYNASRMLNKPIGEASDLLFAQKFLVSLLKEQDETMPEPVEDPEASVGASPDEFTPDKTKQAFDNSLDSDTDPNEFDVEGISTDVTVETINRVKDWAVKLNEFEEFLNNPSDTSLHRILADNDRAGSLLRGITRKASDSITRIAGEIAKLKEVLNTFVNTAPKKMRDTEQLKMGS
jgi:hypothetical protein